MPVVLKFQPTGSIPGKGEPVPMIGHSLTIGRGGENDLVLPDPDRTLSKRHCAIEDHNGNVIVVDFSTNGTFLNYGKLPLGSVPTPLNDGDILSLGPYELMVSISSGKPDENLLADPLADGPVSHGQAGAAPSIADLLDAPGDGGDFLDELLTGRDGPVGPSGVQREELGEDGLLPPLGDDDPILPPLDADAGQGGASQRDNSTSSSDYFNAPKPTGGGSVIPDDWEEDFLPSAPAGNSEDPFASPFGGTPAGNAAFIPDDLDFDAPESDRDPALAPTFPGDEPDANGTNDAPSDVTREPAAPEHSVSDHPAPTLLSKQTGDLEDPGQIEETRIPPQGANTEPEQATAGPKQDGASRVFLKSLGAEDVNITAEDLTSTMSRLGHVLRIMVEGMREILMTRTSIKSEFRIEQTMIQAGGNNPLKFSISPDQAIEAMVKPSAKGYLDATEAAHQALNDIKAHEVAMVTGMEAALKGVLKRLDPGALEEKIKVGGGFSSVLKSKKARYWEIYETMYAEIADQAENDFQELFAKEFARAYKEQLDKLK